MTSPSSVFVGAIRPSQEGDPAAYFRRGFSVSEGLRRAELVVTALGVVETYVNGERLGDEVLAPGWTSYRHRVVARRHDVTALLLPGENAFGAIVGEGWAVGALTWENNRHNYADRPALYARLELVYSDHTEIINADGDVRVGAGAIVSSGIYAGETYDARAEPHGWAQAGFDDSAWEQAIPVSWDIATVTVDDTPPIRRIEELAPVSITTSPSGRAIVDFGQNISGWVRLQVNGEAGTTITLRHAELLTPAGELEIETLRSAAATDRYTLRGGGSETWEPRFTFHGFRYAEVDGWPGELQMEALRAVVVHSDMVRTGWLETSNPLVTKLHENTVWSMRDNFVGVPTDCPQRDERLGWTGDLNAFAPTATYLYDVRGVLGSWLQDLAVEQADTGTVPWTVPDVLPTGSSATALWSDVAVSLPWALYQEYGDLAILRTAYPSMTAFIREVEAALDEDGLWGSGFQFGDWLDPDAPADNPAGGKTDRYLVACAYLAKTTREMAETARLLGESSDAEHFSALAKRVRAAFRREFVTETGRVVSESATGYALPIMFDLLEESQKRKAGDKLAEIVAHSGFTISTGFAGTPLITDALSSTGHLEEAYELLLQTKSPSFLYPVTMGATTIWERWDSVLPDGTINATGMTSLNHYALGAVADWMHRVIGGLTRTSAGWRTLTIAPQPGGDLTSARAVHDTVLGRAESHWRAEGGEMLFDVVVPEGAAATVVPPLHPDRLSIEVGPGAHSWRYPLPAGFGEEAVLSLETPIKDVMKHDATWQAVLDVMRAYFPGVPVEAAGSHMGDLPLGMLASRLPQNGEAMERDLLAVLETAR
ncbi:family 78 glycoside hydrolase catalytic domain [Microbacterium sp. KSW2-21]|uniref:alpha-L-rhamnosidase n=1 Tax=Microbacterium algihabitans TaxID=3075992 RepID=A0ABU3RZZ4_9MICO|nr:family 78 glycoside hydrolase catalytic domain [Microbacterium sp. KSW2-21]MDU0328446.1 family 78 glycoside hydrolase catalytic domain [Microbacterium sp. KSW2-21]